MPLTAPDAIIEEGFDILEKTIGQVLEARPTRRRSGTAHSRAKKAAERSAAFFVRIDPQFADSSAACS